MGRASGGLVTFVKKSAFDSKQIFSNEHSLFVELKKNDFMLIVGSIYISPLEDSDLALNNFDIILNRIQRIYSDCPIFVGGDCNARLGDLNQLDPAMYTPPPRSNRRNNLDKSSNARGKLLCDLMKQYGYLVLNGRSTADSLGGFTYLDTQGRSTVDLVWSDISASEITLDFEILYSVHTSDHFPVLTKFALPACCLIRSRNLPQI